MTASLHMSQVQKNGKVQKCMFGVAWILLPLTEEIGNGMVFLKPLEDLKRGYIFGVNLYN